MRPDASILHLDLDAFFASVEQRDKPSLRGKPVIVGGIGGRGVVSTCSYEARVFGVRSAMGMTEARRRAPHAAYLAGRFDAYRESSRIVMGVLGELSPLVEPLSLDEAYVDLTAGGIDTSPEVLRELIPQIRATVTERTEGLSASVGVGSSKFIAKLASEAAKPNGWTIVEPGEELDLITPMSVRAIPGIGPATTEKLLRLGVTTVEELQKASLRELTHELGQSAGNGLHELAFARDDRPVQGSREAKSISVEDTFPEDITERGELEAVIARDSEAVAARLAKAGLFARTINLKVRFGDFTTFSRSRTIDGATDRSARIASIARSLLDGIDVRDGVRMLGVGVSGFSAAAQEELFYDDSSTEFTETTEAPSSYQVARPRYANATWVAGQDVEHDEYGRGWVWGSGHGVVTVRFETRLSGPGPVKSLKADDPALHRADAMKLAAAEPGISDDRHVG